MPDATPDSVREVLDVSSNDHPDAEIQPDIDDAANLVSARVQDTDMEATRKRIETLVAAHFVQSIDEDETEHGPVSSVSRGSKSVSFKVPDNSRESSEWWRRALLLTNDELESVADDEGGTAFVTRDRFTGTAVRGDGEHVEGTEEPSGD